MSMEELETLCRKRTRLTWCASCDRFDGECQADGPCRPPEKTWSEALMNNSQPSLWTPGQHAARVIFGTP